MKVNPVSFRGFLIINGANIEHNSGKTDKNVKMVKPANVIYKIKNDKNEQLTRIYSEGKGATYSVPYNVATPLEILAAYTTASQCKDVIVEI